MHKQLRPHHQKNSTRSRSSHRQISTTPRLPTLPTSTPLTTPTTSSLTSSPQITHTSTRYRSGSSNFDYEEKIAIKKGVKPPGRHKLPMNPFHYKMERVPFELIKDNVKLIVADGDLTGRAPSGYKPPGSGGGNQPNEQGEQKGGTDTDMGKNNNNNNNKNKNKNANLNRMIHHDSLRDSSTVLRNSTGKGNIEFLKIGSSVVEKSDLIQIIPQHQFIQYHGQSSPMLSESGLFKNISDQSNSQIA